MNINTKCMGCGKAIQVPEAALNQKLQCRYCGVVFMLTNEAPGWPITPRLISAAQAWGNVSNETAVLPSVRTDAVMVDSDSDRFTSKNPVRPSSSRKVAPFRTMKVAPVTGGHRKIKSSAQMTTIPNEQAEADNMLKFGSLCVVLTLSIFTSLFYFSGGSGKTVKAEKVARVEAVEVPVSYVPKQEVLPVVAPVKKVVAPVVKKVSRPAPEMLTPVEAIPAPVQVVEIIEVENTPVQPVMPKGGAFESLNKAMGDLPNALILPTKVEQAQSLSSKGLHDKAAKLYQEAAEDAEREGRSEEAQLFSLKSIEETRIHQNDVPRLSKRWKF